MLQWWGKISAIQSVWHIGRQTGKSFLLNILAIVKCIAEGNTTVVYVAPVEKKLADYVRPILQTIFEDCPINLRPKYLEADNKLVFRNGSVIHYYGANNENHSNIRGLGNIKLLIDDEAGFMSNLTELIAVVAPMILRSKGRMIHSSSSPVTLTHAFWGLVDDAITNGSYIRCTTEEDETLEPAQLAELAKIFGGRDSTRYRREILCERIVEKTKQVLPEWDSKLYVLSQMDVELIRRDPNYLYFYHLVSFDPGHGGSDPNCITFATYCFGKGILLVEDEIVIPGRDITTNKLVLLIKDKVRELWGNSQRIAYWADPSNQTLLNDMSKLHELSFGWTAKDKKEQAMESLRTFISNARLFLAEKCRLHRLMYETTVWNDQHTEFEHSEVGYHGDAVDSTLYAFRNINYDNPLPAVAPFDPQRKFISPARQLILEQERAQDGFLDELLPDDYPEDKSSF